MAHCTAPQRRTSRSPAQGVPPFTATFGVSHSDSALTVDELIRAAGGALFQAKRSGRNRVAIDNSNSNSGNVTAGN